jgi:23S rRNA pseudouridine1911/1915/1917 synthase
MKDNPASFRSLAPVKSSGQRLDFFLSERCPFFSRSRWQREIKAGRLMVNEKVCGRHKSLKVGDQVKVYFPIEREPLVNRNIRTLYQDEWVLLVDKPAPLPMHENGPYFKNTLSHLLRCRYGEEWAPLHRLDLETSGIVLCAKSSSTRRNIAEQFAEDAVAKEYLAIVCGHPPKRWEVDAPIGDLLTSQIRIKKWVVAGGQRAITTFETLATEALSKVTGEVSSSYSLVRAFPKTGRTNQIRIHLAHKGHRVLGDKLYHEQEEVFLEYFAKGATKGVIAAAGAKRLCLHAHKLTFFHPELGKSMTITSQLPEDFQQTWSDLSKMARL